MRIFLAKGANKNPAIHPAIQVTKSGCVHLGARMQMARRSRYYKSSIDTELECPSARLNRCNGCPATATNISVFVSVSVVKSFGQNFYFFLLFILQDVCLICVGYGVNFRSILDSRFRYYSGG